jgi:undecaprenyl-diphosphatase
MLGAIAVAAICAWLTLREARWYLGPSYQLPPESIAGFSAG